MICLNYVELTFASRFKENNPEVMTSLLQNLGLSTKVAFQDVFSIDEPELLAFVPRPAYALLLVFPVSETYEKFRTQEDAGKEEYIGRGDGEEVVWFKQTIGNACGLIGVLHAVSNGQARNHIGKWTICSSRIIYEADEKAIIVLSLPKATLVKDTDIEFAS